MAINNNKKVSALYNNGTQLVLNTQANPRNSYADIYRKVAAHIYAEDLQGMTSLPSNFYSSSSTLQSIILASSIKSIENVAFDNVRTFFDIIYDKENAENSQLTTIRNGAFNIANVNNAIFPDSVTTVEQGAFLNGGANIRKLSFGAGLSTVHGGSNSGAINNFILRRAYTDASQLPALGTTTSLLYYTQNIWVADETSKTLLSSAANWSSSASKMKVMHTIYLDGVAKQICVNSNELIATGLVNGLLSDDISENLGLKYDFFYDSDYTQPITPTNYYVDGLILYGRTKQGE